MPSDFGPPTLLIRFSYPAQGGFRAAGPDAAAVAARLHAPDRLARRFALFEALTLPSLLAQTDRGFRTLVLVGDSLPAEARARLERLLAPLPGAAVVALPHLHAYEAACRAFASVPTQGRWRVTLRLDDDDALERGFIARLKARLPQVRGLLDDRPLILAWMRGYTLDLRGPRPVFSPVVERLPLGCGLAMLAPATSRENIYRRNHRWLPQFCDVLSEAHSPSFLRSVHDLNDSAAESVGRRLEMPPQALAAELAAGFPFLPDAWLPTGDPACA